MKSSLLAKQGGFLVLLLLETISTTLAKEEKIQLVGYGTFEVRNRAARMGRNPQTVKKYRLGASKVPAFKSGKELKEAVK